MGSLSHRYLEALDALEEFRLLHEMLKQMDDAYARAQRHWPPSDWEKPFFIMVDLPEFRKRAWYIEVSLQRLDEASRAVTTAAERYEAKFDAAALHRQDFRSLLHKQGLPDPYEINRDANYRHPIESWWHRMFSSGYHPPTRWPLTTKRPESDEFTFYCLNDPDPSAAIAFWRDSANA